MSKNDSKTKFGLIVLGCLMALFLIIFLIIKMSDPELIPSHVSSGILMISFIIVTGILLLILGSSINPKYMSFIKRHLSAIITAVAALVFLLIRLAFPDFVKSNTADVLLLLFVPLLVLVFMITYKIEEQKKDIENLKSDFFETLGSKVKSFDTKEDCDSYYKNKITCSKIIKDFTWAEVLSKEYDTELIYTDLIKGKQEYQEIFIFSINGFYRQDRLLKLKSIYEHIKDGKEHLNYSCSFYEETKFERLQYTILDEKEILFTSSYYPRCIIEGDILFNILSKYFDQAWKDSKENLLIDCGRIVNENEEKIKQLISEIK